MGADAAYATIHDALETVDPMLRPVLERLLKKLSDADLEDREPRDVVGAAGSMYELAVKRAPGETLVSVFTPTLAEHGWTSRRTIVNICTADSPFLVDSVGMTVAQQGLSVHALLHPVVSVRRDDDGTLLETDVAGGDLESWIH